MRRTNSDDVFLEISTESEESSHESELSVYVRKAVCRGYRRGPRQTLDDDWCGSACDCYPGDSPKCCAAGKASSREAGCYGKQAETAPISMDRDTAVDAEGRCEASISKFVPVRS